MTKSLKKKAIENILREQKQFDYPDVKEAVWRFEQYLKEKIKIRQDVDNGYDCTIEKNDLIIFKQIFGDWTNK